MDQEAKAISFAALRREATERLQGHNLEWDELSLQDTQRLIHELHIHYTELELQYVELRRTQQELEHSRDKYADLYHFAPLCYFIIDDEGIVLDANRTSATSLQTDRRSLQQKPLHRFIHYADQDIFYLWRRALFGGRRQPCELRFVRQEGSFFYAQLDGAIVAGERNKARLARVAASDVTELKQAEAALRTSEERHRLLVQTSPHAILYTTPELEIILSNREAAELFGFADPEAMIGVNLLALMPPEDQAWLRAETDRITPDQPGKDQEVTFSRRDGNRFVAEVNAARVGDDAERSGALILVVRDVTERRQAQTYLLRTQRLVAMGKMAAVLAHEIKNPLQAIQSNLELVLDFPLDKAEQDQHLRQCYQQVEHLVGVTQRVLTTVHSEAQPAAWVSMPDLLRRTLALVENTTRQKHVNTITEIAADMPLIQAVPDHIVQVLLNLALNAVEATADGSDIHIRASIEQNNVKVTIANYGCLIPRQHLERIFDPFFTTKASGTGLGLSISQNIVEQHGGTLTVQNLIEETGVVFTLSLPIHS